MRHQYRITYRGFLQSISRTFTSLQRAKQWCRQIGRPDLIRWIVREEVA